MQFKCRLCPILCEKMSAKPFLSYEFWHIDCANGILIYSSYISRAKTNNNRLRTEARSHCCRYLNCLFHWNCVLKRNPHTVIQPLIFINSPRIVRYRTVFKWIGSVSLTGSAQRRAITHVPNCLTIAIWNNKSSSKYLISSFFVYMWTGEAFKKGKKQIESEKNLVLELKETRYCVFGADCWVEHFERIVCSHCKQIEITNHHPSIHLGERDFRKKEAKQTIDVLSILVAVSFFYFDFQLTIADALFFFFLLRSMLAV